MVLSIVNHKGGVGKTTIAVNLALYLSKYYKKILFMDFDPQGNASDMLCPNCEVPYKTSDVLKKLIMDNVGFSSDNQKKQEFDKVFQASLVCKAVGDSILCVMTSDLELTKTKIELTARESLANFKIKEMIDYYSKQHDLTIIDTPPSIELLTFAALASSNYFIIPVQLNTHAVKGAMDIINDILPIVQTYYNKNCQLAGVVLNTHEPRTKVGKVALKTLEDLFKEKFFNTKISRSIKINESNILKTSLQLSSSGSKSDKEFKSLAKEVYERLRGGIGG